MFTIEPIIKMDLFVLPPPFVEGEERQLLDYYDVSSPVRYTMEKTIKNHYNSLMTSVLR